jgi:hypothetical protein
MSGARAWACSWLSVIGGALGIPVAAAASTATTLAPLVVVEGTLRVDGRGVDDLVAMDLVVSTENGEEILTLRREGVVVVAGHFAVDVDLGDVPSGVRMADRLTISVHIDDGDHEATGVLAVGPAAAAALADVVDVAPRAELAYAVRSENGSAKVAADFVSAASLAVPGGPSVSWQNVVEKPTGLDDGDDGNVFSVGQGLEVDNGVLHVGPLEAAWVENGSVDGDRFAAATLSGQHLTQLTGADFEPGSLTGADFASGTFTSAQVSGNRQVVYQESLGCAVPGQMTTSPTCSTVLCPDGSRRRCERVACSGAALTCPNTPMGQLLFAP